MQNGYAPLSIGDSKELNDSGVYEARCQRGHQSYVILQQHKFEVLFDVGACALLDGYHREAVSSFSASLERFREFFFRSALLEYGIETKEIDTAWKQLAKQSERQFGAFTAIYLRECGQAPPVLSSKNVEFRNDVIHKGRIPERSEAIAYGDAVLDTVRPAILLAKSKFPIGVKKMIEGHLFVAHQSLPPGSQFATSCMPTILNLTGSDTPAPEVSLEEVLKDQEMWSWRS